MGGSKTNRGRNHSHLVPLRVPVLNGRQLRPEHLGELPHHTDGAASWPVVGTNRCVSSGTPAVLYRNPAGGKSRGRTPAQMRRGKITGGERATLMGVIHRLHNSDARCDCIARHQRSSLETPVSANKVNVFPLLAGSVLSRLAMAWFESSCCRWPRCDEIQEYRIALNTGRAWPPQPGDLSPGWSYDYSRSALPSSWARLCPPRGHPPH